MPDDIIKDALDRFRESEEGSEYNRDDYAEDVRFARLGDQWPQAVKKQRVQEGRPALVVNKLAPLIRAVVNEARQNTPGIRISPVDNGADEDTAEIISGLIRSIERSSNAGVAYDTAIDHAVTGGFGFFRIAIDYAHDETFNLEARIERIANALQVHWDTSTTAFDASDWEFAFVSEMVKKRDYEKRYPDASLVPFDGDSRDDAAASWVNDDEIRVAEYFLRVEKTRNLIQIAVPNQQTGQVDLRAVREDELPHMARAFFEGGQVDTSGMGDDEVVRAFMAASGIEERRRREVRYKEVKRRIINGVEILEEEDWPGSLIPICPVWGDETFIDGRRYFRSMIRDAKDSQQMLNFWRSSSAELVALAPRAPWVGPHGFVPTGHEQKWATANTRSHAYLEYNPDAGAAPQRVPFAGVPTGVMQEALTSSDDMKAITGIFDSSIGARSNETSGKAILARERQGDVSNYHFIDNLSRAIQYAGRVLVEIIPSVYSPQETVRILGEDQASKVVGLTQQPGGDGLYNLAVGKYDVEVKTGPSFQTQREETRETLIEIMRQVPDAAPILGDVLIDHMDFVGSDKIAARLNTLLPPEIRKAESDDGGNPEMAMLQQQAQAQQAEAQAQIQQLQQQIEWLAKEGEALKADKSFEVQKARSDAAMSVEKMNRETEAKAAENRIKQMELEIKSREVAIKEAEAQAKIAMEAARLEDEIGRESAKAEAAESALQQAVAAGAERQAEMVRAVAEIMNAPRRIIRDKQGRVVGAETVVSEENPLASLAAQKRIVRDEGGNAIGIEVE